MYHGLWVVGFDNNSENVDAKLFRNRCQNRCNFVSTSIKNQYQIDQKSIQNRSSWISSRPARPGPSPGAPGGSPDTSLGTPGAVPVRPGGPRGRPEGISGAIFGVFSPSEFARTFSHWKNANFHRNSLNLPHAHPC